MDAARTIRTVDDLTPEELQALGRPHLGEAQDTTSGAVEDAVPKEITLLEGDRCKVTYLYKDGHLIFHAWRGPSIPAGDGTYWGQGGFGLAFMAAVRHVFSIDEPQFDYVPEVESYFGIILNATLKPTPVSQERLTRVARELDERVKRDVAC